MPYTLDRKFLVDHFGRQQGEAFLQSLFCHLHQPRSTGA